MTSPVLPPGFGMTGPAGETPTSLHRVLVTGGGGFLGSHLSERLLRAGSWVTCLDNFSTGSRANVAHLASHPRFRLLDHDVTVPFEPEDAYTAVFHLASPASPPAYPSAPVETLRAGSEGTENALEVARRARAVFLLASTSEVYGDPDVHPQPESYRGNVLTTGPRSIYDEAKRYAEALTMAYHRAHGVATRIVRIFNTYGPRLAPGYGRAISTFIRQARDGGPLTVYGDGSQTRSFCYVDDLVGGIVSAARLADHEPVNLGNPDERSILEVARLVLRVTGSRSGIEFLPLPEDDPHVRRPDISRACRLLGWEPCVYLEEGIRRTVAWFDRASFAFRSPGAARPKSLASLGGGPA
jgi:dTDP-glucose 4,6-dehydratase